MTAACRDEFRGVIGSALDLRRPERVPRAHAFDRARSLAMVQTIVQRLDEALRRLQWVTVPVLMERPMRDILCACMDALEEYSRVLKVLDGTPSWEALEAYHALRHADIEERTLHFLHQQKVTRIT